MGKKNKAQNRDTILSTISGTVGAYEDGQVYLKDVTVKGRGHPKRMTDLTISPGKALLPKYLAIGAKVWVRMDIALQNKNGEITASQIGKVYNFNCFPEDTVATTIKNLEENKGVIEEGFETARTNNNNESTCHVVDVDTGETKQHNVYIPYGSEVDISPDSEKIFLIDFENYPNASIIIDEEKGTPDRSELHFFYSDNCTSKELPLFLFITKGAYVKAHHTKTGEQVLDRQLTSYVGYLIGKYGKEKEIIIISRDRGYVSTIDFWKSEGYNNVHLWSKISAKKGA